MTALRTAQGEVSAHRLNELLVHPESSTMPRLGHRREVPMVYERAGSGGTAELLDGNHRAVSEVVRGAMFMHVQSLTRSDFKDVRERSAVINARKGWAAINPRAASPETQYARQVRNYGLPNQLNQRQA